MRLTFRRLLAYLDGVCDEQDVEVLGQKISESDFASRLIHRIRNAKTRLRLGAPRLVGKGMGLDPNTVSEYLDYTLNEDRVPDFEKVCLESDVHLAEVAASHEILTLVLAEPAQVERSIRERMYSLPEEPRSRQVELDNGVHARTDGTYVESAPTQEATARREISQFLDQRTEPRWRSMLLTMALSFMLVIVGLRAVGPFDSSHPLIGRFLGPSEPVAMGDPPSGVDDSQPSPLDSDPPADPSDNADPQKPEPPQPKPENSVDTEVGSPTPTPDPALAPGREEEPKPAPIPAIPAPPSETEPIVPPVEETNPPVEPPPEPNASGDPPATVDEGPMGVDVGRFTSESSVLTRFDVKSQSWLRIPSRDVVRSGDRLLAPPVFRPQLALASGIQLVVIGPAELKMLPPRDGKPVIQVLHGRVLVETVATPGAEVDFDLAGERGTVVLTGVDSSAAIEVSWFSPPGHDPRRGTQRAILWTSLRGEIAWKNPDTDVGTMLTAGMSIKALGDTIMAPAAQTPPNWTDASKLKDVPLLDYRYAIPALEAEFSPELAASLTLEELLEHRMADVGSLALRSLSDMNQFSAYVKALNNGKKRAYWETEYTAMRRSLSRGASAANAMRSALEAEYPDQVEIVERLYQLCVSANDEQLAAGAAAKMVDDLTSDEMAIRVLAYENLRRMTGKTHLYLPDKHPNQQRIAVNNWRKSLENGEIRWKSLPQPLE